MPPSRRSRPDRDQADPSPAADQDVLAALAAIHVGATQAQVAAGAAEDHVSAAGALCRCGDDRGVLLTAGRPGLTLPLGREPDRCSACRARGLCARCATEELLIEAAKIDAPSG